MFTSASATALCFDFVPTFKSMRPCFFCFNAGPSLLTFSIALVGLWANPTVFFVQSCSHCVHWLHTHALGREQTLEAATARQFREVHDLHPAETLRSCEKLEGRGRDTCTSSRSSERFSSTSW